MSESCNATSTPKTKPQPKQWALVTGAGIRIGRAIATELAQQGFAVVVHYNHSSVEALSLVEELTQQGHEAVALQADLSQESACHELIKQASNLGELSVLVNSAAIFPENDTMQSSLAHWGSVMNVNLRAPLLLSQAFAQNCKNSESKRNIINILDSRTRKPAGDHIVYRLSKSALWHMTECLAHDFTPHIRVNGVALGAIMAPPGATDDHFQRMAQHIPLKETGEPEQIAQAVSFLVKQPFITGTIIPIDGGEFL